VLTAGKVRCSPSSPCSRARARCAWLRVAPLLSSPSLRAVTTTAPGRDGKAGCRSNRKAALRYGDPDKQEPLPGQGGAAACGSPVDDRQTLRWLLSTQRRLTIYRGVGSILVRQCSARSRAFQARQYGHHPDCRATVGTCADRMRADWCAFARPYRRHGDWHLQAGSLTDLGRV
jgi:hypothetical protein